MKTLMNTPESALAKTARQVATPNACKGKFTVRRIVNWGDCDPAGIVYTPRVLDYVCETIDAF
ncbi:MAG: hypothetical protein WB820_02120, partial [Rhodoplanes sp.]